MRASGVGGRGSSFRCLHRAVRGPPPERVGDVQTDTRRATRAFSSHLRGCRAQCALGAPVRRKARLGCRRWQSARVNISCHLESTTPAVRPFAHTPRDLLGPTWSDLVASDWRKSPFTGGIFWIFAFAERKSAPGLTSTPRPASAALPEAARTCRSRVEVSRERRGGAAREPRDSRVGGSVETLRATSKGRRRFLRRSRGIDKPALQARREATDSAPPRDERPARARCRARRGPWCTSTTGRRARRGAGLAV